MNFDKFLTLLFTSGNCDNPNAAFKSVDLKLKPSRS